MLECDDKNSTYRFTLLARILYLELRNTYHKDLIRMVKTQEYLTMLHLILPENRVSKRVIGDYNPRHNPQYLTPDIVQ